MTDVMKASLSQAQKRLVEHMQQVNFGYIKKLSIKDGEPDFTIAPIIVREIKFGGENKPREEVTKRDFALRSEILELFEYFEHIQNGTVQSLYIKHGIPFTMSVQEELKK